MGAPADFVGRLEAVHTRDIVELLKGEDWPHVGAICKLKNEVRLVARYCYFGARFGALNERPNDSIVPI